MKPVVNDSCIACGTCEGVCPEVFKVQDKDGKMKSFFIVVSNTRSDNNDTVRKGAEKVLRAGGEGDGNSPALTSVRSAMPIAVQDLASATARGLWYEEALAQGQQSCAFFPRASGNDIIGVLSVFYGFSYFLLPAVVAVSLWGKLLNAA